MQKFTEWLDEKVMPFAAAFGAQRHLSAIRRSFLNVIPLILLGSFYTLLSSVYWLGERLSAYSGFFTLANNVSFGLAGIYLTVCITYLLAKSYELEEIPLVLLALVNFITTSAKFITDADGISGIQFTYLGSYGMFGGILVSIITVELYRLLRKWGIYIRGPKGVPQGVVSFIENIVPYVIVNLPFLVLAYNGWLLTQRVALALSPLFRSADTYGAVLLANFVSCLCWFMGVHPWAMIGPVYFPFLVANGIANAEAYAAGKPLPYITTFGSYFGNAAGGTGNHFPLAFYGLFSKSQTIKAVAKAAIVTTFFNINEPTIFGYPVALNPVYFIPQVIISPIVHSLYYLVVYYGLVPRPANPFFSFVPPGFYAFFSTPQAPFQALFWGLLVGLVPAAIYWYPFFKVHERQLLRQEAEMAKAN